MTKVLEQLADSDPHLRIAYDLEAAEWEQGQPPRTILASALAHSFIDYVDAIPEGAVSSIFSICEATLQAGSEDSTSMATGFLETLQHADGRDDFDFSRVVPFLGPRSKAHCEAMDRFHGAATRGL